MFLLEPTQKTTNNPDHEELWLLFGGRIGCWWWGRKVLYRKGQYASVDFDPDFVWENRKSISAFVHTHPRWTATPSGIDVATMGAWVNSLGRPLPCLIHGTNGLRAWWFKDDSGRFYESWVRQIGKLYIGRIPDAIRA
jgi:hypothetical protein